MAHRVTERLTNGVDLWKRRNELHHEDKTLVYERVPRRTPSPRLSRAVQRSGLTHLPAECLRPPARRRQRSDRLHRRSVGVSDTRQVGHNGHIHRRQGGLHRAEQRRLADSVGAGHQNAAGLGSGQKSGDFVTHSVATDHERPVFAERLLDRVHLGVKVLGGHGRTPSTIGATRHTSRSSHACSRCSVFTIFRSVPDLGAIVNGHWDFAVGGHLMSDAAPLLSWTYPPNAVDSPSPDLKLIWEASRMNLNLVHWDTGQPQPERAHWHGLTQESVGTSAIQEFNIRLVHALLERLWQWAVAPGLETYHRVGTVRARVLERPREWRTSRGTPMTSQEGDWWVWESGPDDRETDGRGASGEAFLATHRPTDEKGVYERTTQVRAGRLTARVLVRTDEGDDVGEPGDWRLIDARGSMWVVDDARFRATYTRYVAETPSLAK